MKAVGEYFLMEAFLMLLLDEFKFLQILCLIWTEKHGRERIEM